MSLCLQAQIEQWIEFSTLEIDPPLCSWYYPIAGYFPFDKKVRALSRALPRFRPACFPAVLRSPRRGRMRRSSRTLA